MRERMANDNNLCIESGCFGMLDADVVRTRREKDKKKMLEPFLFSLMQFVLLFFLYISYASLRLCLCMQLGLKCSSYKHSCTGEKGGEKGREGAKLF